MYAHLHSFGLSMVRISPVSTRQEPQIIFRLVRELPPIRRPAERTSGSEFVEDVEFSLRTAEHRHREDACLRSIRSNKSNGAAVRRPGGYECFTRLVRKLLDPFCANDFDVKVKHALGGVSPPIPREHNLFSVRRKSRPPHISGQRSQRRDADVLIGGFSRPSRFAFTMQFM